MAGRKIKPYITSWKEPIAGLTQCGDGRWRIAATEQRFTEADERRAIEKFYALTGQRRQPDMVEMKAPVSAISAVPFACEVASTPEEIAANGLMVYRATKDFPGRITMNLDQPPADWQASIMAPGSVVWTWLRELLDNDPAFVAQMLDRPALANFRQFPTPAKPVKISDIIAAYREHSPATAKGQKEALAAFDLLVNFCQAKTISDFSDERLREFRQHVVKDMGLTSSGTIVAYFSRCRSVLKLALRGKLDNAQLTASLELMKAKMYSPENNVDDDPHPISRENFHALLNGVTQTDVPAMWRAMLLLGLNAALYMEDLCELRWENLDLDKGTFLARRKKKGRCLRAATLWPETIAAMKALPRGGSPFVFVSNRGTRYNKNTKINDFKDFREKIGQGTEEVTWSHVRDGAYTAATHARGVDAKFGELLAGHKCGMKDKYVLRSPEIVKPACDAVYEVYGPF